MLGTAQGCMRAACALSYRDELDSPVPVRQHVPVMVFYGGERVPLSRGIPSQNPGSPEGSFVDFRGIGGDIEQQPEQGGCPQVGQEARPNLRPELPPVS